MGICNRRTTQSGGMHRRSNAAGTFATGCLTRLAPSRASQTSLARGRRCRVAVTPESGRTHNRRRAWGGGRRVRHATAATGRRRRRGTGAAQGRPGRAARAGGGGRGAAGRARRRTRPARQRRSPSPSTYSAGATFGGQRSPRLKVTASKGRMRTGASSCAVAISTHSPSRSSKASRVRSAGSTSHR